ncbi:MAG TPA: DsbA family protein [Longimicrobiales bacterium]
MQEERLIVFADYVSPLCCLADHVVRRFRQKRGVRVDGAAFELRPPGTPLADPGAPGRIDEWQRHVAPLAGELGVELKPPAVATRTRKAHEAAAYARSVGRFDAMHGAILGAYWEAGADIGRIDVLVEIGRGIGLDATGLRVALDIDQWTERVEADEAWAAQLGVQGVPAYVRAATGADGTTVAADIGTGLRQLDELEAWWERKHDI